MTMHVFDNDDGVIHHQADRQHHGKKCEKVDGIAEREQDHAHPDQRERDGRDRDHHRAERSQEYQDHDHHDDDRFAERLEHFVDRGLDEDRIVERGLHGNPLRQILRDLLDLGVGGMAQLEPGQIGSAGAGGGGLVPFGSVQGAGGKVFLLVGDKHDEGDVGAIVAHQGGLAVGHNHGHLPGTAAHRVMLDHAGGAILVHDDLRNPAVMVGVGSLGILPVQLGHGLDAGGGSGGVIGVQWVQLQIVVLFGTQVGVPRRLRAEAVDPGAVDGGEVDRTLGLHGQRAVVILIDPGQQHAAGRAAVPAGGLVGLAAVGQQPVVFQVADQP